MLGSIPAYTSLKTCYVHVWKLIICRGKLRQNEVEHFGSDCRERGHFLYCFHEQICSFELKNLLWLTRDFLPKIFIELNLNKEYKENKINTMCQFILARNINEIHGDGTISVSQCQRWNYNLKDDPRPGRSIELDVDIQQTLVEQHVILIVQELSKKLGFGRSTIHLHLCAIGKVRKSSQWTPHKL